MDSGNSCSNRQPKPSSLIPKTERKIVEKNRRNQMKFLYSKLSSLLPHHVSQDGAQLPDRIDEAVNYIKGLQVKIERSKEKKEKLLSRKRSHGSMTSTENRASSSKSIEIEIHDMGPDLDIVLITGLDNHPIFYDVIRLLDEEAGEVVHASFSTSGPSTFHVHHKQIGEAHMFKRLKELIHGTSCNNELTHGSSCNEEDSKLDLWDFDIQSDVWEFGFPEVVPMRIIG